MLDLLVSPAQWAYFDNWYNFISPTIFFAFGACFIFVGLLPISCIKNKITITLFIINVCLGLILAAVVYVHNQSAKEYFKESHYVSAMTRTYSFQLFSKQYYAYDDVDTLRYISDPSTPLAIKSVYKATQVKEPITYLGKDDCYVYIKMHNQKLKFGKDICRKINGNVAYMTGYRFDMRSAGFSKIGFLKLPNYFRDKLEIPAKLWNTKAPQKVINNYDRPGLVGRWITDSCK